MRVFLLYAVIFLLPFSVGACKEDSIKNEEVFSRETTSLTILTEQGPGHHFDVELALTVPEYTKGLMHRPSLAKDSGMLFYFYDNAERGFWMKDTLIPLDLLFIKKDGRVHYIHKNALPHDITSLKSKGAVRAVLEINAGLADKLGIQIGDIIRHSLFQQENAQ